MIRVVLAACAVALSLSACNQASVSTADAGASGPADDFPGSHQDANGDGRVTLDEVKDGEKGMLARADTNRDGKIGLGEIEALRERAAERLHRMDTDGDRQVTAAELETAAVERFRRRDVNEDGVLTANEMRVRNSHGEAGSPVG